MTQSPNITLDAIEAARERSHGHAVRIDPFVDPDVDRERKSFTGWKLDMIWKMAADRRLKPDSYARVGIAILRHVNQWTYDAFPAQKTIAREASVSVTTVKKAIAALAEFGYLSVGKRRRCNRYLPPIQQPWLRLGRNSGEVPIWPARCSERP